MFDCKMDVDDDNAPSRTKGKSRADKLPALAMVLDKVQRVEDVCRDNAKRSQQFEYVLALRSVCHGY